MSAERVERTDRTPYGFMWGPMMVTCMATMPDGRRVLRVATDHSEVEVYVSQMGRSVRVFVDGEAAEVAA